MQRLSRGLLAFILLATLAYAAPAAASDGCSFKTKEKSFMRKFNDKRENNGKSRLAWDLDMGRVARHHTRKMVSQGTIFHSGDNGTHSVTVHLTSSEGYTLGEIVGRGQTVDSLVDAFMNSSSHRSIILDSAWTRMGAGTIDTNTNYPLYVTVLFANKNLGTTFHAC